MKIPLGKIDTGTALQLAAIIALGIITAKIFFFLLFLTIVYAIPTIIKQMGGLV